jgi:hypothetical protein
VLRYEEIAARTDRLCHITGRNLVETINTDNQNRSPNYDMTRSPEIVKALEAYGIFAHFWYPDFWDF